MRGSSIQSIRILWILAVSGCALMLAVPFAASAHVGGASIEQAVDGYLVDIGYSSLEPRANEQIRFDFLLYDAETGEEIPFTDIWVRLEEDKTLLFAGGLGRAEFGTTGMTLTFAEGGVYEGFVRFSDADGAIVETTFGFPVANAPQTWTVSVESALAFVFGVFVGLGAGFLWYRTRRLHTRPQEEPAPQPDSGVQVSSTRSIAISIVVGLVCALGAFYATTRLLAGDMFSTEEPPIVDATPAEGSVAIVLTKTGFEPSEVTVRTGTTVTFSTTAGRPFWPASNLHPTHEIYSAFDPKKPIPADETWSFTFDRVGSWNMHDHIRSYFTGTIHVVP